MSIPFGGFVPLGASQVVLRRRFLFGGTKYCQLPNPKAVFLSEGQNSSTSTIGSTSTMGRKQAAEVSLARGHRKRWRLGRFAETGQGIEPGTKFIANLSGRPGRERLVTFSGVRAIVLPPRRTKSLVAFSRIASNGSAACKRTRSARHPGAIPYRSSCKI